MKRKNLNKRIRRLEASIAKDTKKLVKLRRRLAEASKPAANKARPVESTTSKTATAAKPAPQKKKKKRQLSPETRAKMAARMKERWAAKRAGEAAAPSPTGAESTAEVGWPA
jgi:hypothetical protein